MPDASSLDPHAAAITKVQRRSQAQRLRHHQAMIQAELRRLSSVRVHPLPRADNGDAFRDGQLPAA